MKSFCKQKIYFTLIGYIYTIAYLTQGFIFKKSFAHDIGVCKAVYHILLQLGYFQHLH